MNNIFRTILKEVDRGRQGLNTGASMGLPKLEGIIDGVTQGTYTLIISSSGSGKHKLDTLCEFSTKYLDRKFQQYLEYCRVYEESYILLQVKNGKIRIDDPVLNLGHKGPKSV